jgi:hypothetical protein
MLNADRTYIGFPFVVWQITEDWCNFDCLVYSSAKPTFFVAYINVILNLALLALLTLLIEDA